MKAKRIVLFLVLLFAIVYYAVRIAIFYAGSTGSMEFEREQSQLVENIVSFSFLAIGVLGLAMLPGVYLSRPWGFWGTIAVNVYTVVFDVWAAVVVQSSAAAGIIPAGVLLGYLLLMRKDLLKVMVPGRAEASRKRGST